MRWQIELTPNDLKLPYFTEISESLSYNESFIWVITVCILYKITWNALFSTTNGLFGFVADAYSLGIWKELELFADSRI